jgi:hypothetical protein
MTTQEQLDQVRSAITAIETGAQEYQVGGRRVTKADLKTLYERERVLMQRLDIETNGGRVYYGSIG